MATVPGFTNPPGLADDGPIPEGLDVREEIEELMNKPLSREEVFEIQRTAESSFIYGPRKQYERDALREHDRVVAALAQRDRELGDAPDDPLERRQRVAIYLRHIIKKRWVAFGVWNPEWGIPGGPKECQGRVELWEWPWQGDESACGITDLAYDPENPYVRSSYDPDHPNSVAARLREGLARGERRPITPRSSLGPDPDKATAESFITSRPWYVYAMDLAEESVRQGRIPTKYWGFSEGDWHPAVQKRWRESGEQFSCIGSEGLAGWKWRHESPSPRPEEDLADIEFTPSEVDELESIRPQRLNTPPAGSLRVIAPIAQAARVLAPQALRRSARVAGKIKRLEAAAADGPPARTARTQPRGSPSKNAAVSVGASSPPVGRATRAAAASKLAAQPIRCGTQAPERASLATRPQGVGKRNRVPLRRT